MPIVRITLGTGRSPDQKAALAKVVLAKGGRRESDFVRLFDAHRPLRTAVARLARQHARRSGG